MSTALCSEAATWKEPSWRILKALLVHACNARGCLLLSTSISETSLWCLAASAKVHALFVWGDLVDLSGDAIGVLRSVRLRERSKRSFSVGSVLTKLCGARYMCTLARTAFTSCGFSSSTEESSCCCALITMGGCVNIGWTIVACQLWCWSPEYTAALLRRKSTLSVDAIVKAFSISRLLIPAFFWSRDTEWIIHFRVSTEEQIPNLVINSVEPPRDSTVSLNTAWKGGLHSLLVIKSTQVFDATCKCTVFYRTTASLTFIHRLGKLMYMFPQFRSSRTHCIYKLIDIKSFMYWSLVVLFW